MFDPTKVRLMQVHHAVNWLKDVADHHYQPTHETLKGILHELGIRELDEVIDKEKVASSSHFLAQEKLDGSFGLMAIVAKLGKRRRA